MRNVGRRELLIGGAAASIARPARAWFPHGKQAAPANPLFPITFNWIYDSTWIAGAPAGAYTVLAQLQTDVNKWFGSSVAPVTINITMYWQNQVGLASSGWDFVNTLSGMAYSTFRSTLLNLPTNNWLTAQNPNFLPSSNPFGSQKAFATTANWAIVNGTNDTSSTNHISVSSNASLAYND